MSYYTAKEDYLKERMDQQKLAIDRAREYGVEKLMSVAMAAKIPSGLSQEDYMHGTEFVPSPGGWFVEAVYDGDSLEGIHSFIDPQGRAVSLNNLEDEDRRWADFINFGSQVSYPY